MWGPGHRLSRSAARQRLLLVVRADNTIQQKSSTTSTPPAGRGRDRAPDPLEEAQPPRNSHRELCASQSRAPSSSSPQSDRKKRSLRHPPWRLWRPAKPPISLLVPDSAQWAADERVPRSRQAPAAVMSSPRQDRCSDHGSLSDRPQLRGRTDRRDCAMRRLARFGLPRTRSHGRARPRRSRAGAGSCTRTQSSRLVRARRS